jgi:ribonuclease HII
MSEIKYKIGIDEVGRGPVAGPVAVCATFIEIVNQEYLIDELEGMTDSKKLSEKKRELLFEKVKKLKDFQMLFSSVVFVSARDIDAIGIIQSIQKALDKSLENIFKNKELAGVSFNQVQILLDGGLHADEKFVNQETIIKGDEKEFTIATASVTAKVLRDRKMKEYGNQFPQYLFEKHKGYGTKVHMEAIQKHGFSVLHRKSFLKKFI